MPCILKIIARSVIIVIILCLLAACGGGGGGSTSGTPVTPEPTPDPTPTPVQQTTAVLSLYTAGILPVALAGVGVTIALPAGVTPKLDASGNVDNSVVQVSGVAAPGSQLSVFTPATATDKGKLTLAVASSSQAGFTSGEYAVVTLRIASGTTVSSNDFSLTGFSAIATTGTTSTVYTPGFTATIQ